MLNHSPIESIIFRDQRVWVKRDDLLHPEFSGNKARKFAYFLAMPYRDIQRLVGYGSAQANSLYSMSALAKLRGWQFEFYVDHIANYLQQNPSGNYAAALANGAQVINLQDQPDRGGLTAHAYIKQKILPQHEHTLFIPEGGRCEYAQYGVHQLAAEIAVWFGEQHLSQLDLVLPAGTGTTALFLKQYFVQQQLPIEVKTCACVGGDDYLRQQFFQLEKDINFHPKIINLGKKYHFGKLYLECYQMWQEVCASGIEFELLYDPLGWILTAQCLQQAPKIPILYLHQGGLLGNESMLARYRRKYDNTI